MTMQEKSILVLCADGTEEMEAIITIDILRRAQFQVTLSNIHSTSTPSQIQCAQKSRLIVDIPSDQSTDIKAQDYDMVVLPGGMGGARTFEKNPVAQRILKEFAGSGKWVAAICAAPVALKAAQVFPNARLTSHPVVKEEMVGGYQYLEDRVVVDGKLITSRGPGTAFDFALTIVSQLAGKEKAIELTKPMFVAEGVTIL